MSAPVFELHERLARDTVAVGRLPLSLVRWSRDARYPWALLVPMRTGVREIHELSAEDRHALIDEIALVSDTLSRRVAAHKMNVAAIGNIVAQLHVHVIARFHGDDAWPGPVWGAHPPLPYEERELLARVSELRAALSVADPSFVPESD